MSDRLQELMKDIKKRCEAPGRCRKCEKMDCPSNQYGTCWIGLLQQEEITAITKVPWIFHAIADLQAENERLRIRAEKADGLHSALKLSNELLAEEQSENAALREAQRWIPATERLPDRLQDVLVYAASCNKVFKAFYAKDWCFSFDNTPIEETVTHWRPLPAAPDGQKGEQP